jgi:hypothetical protein
VLSILLDENIDGYADYLSGLLFSSEWNEISSFLGIRILTLPQAGLATGTPDAELWDFCHNRQFYLLTDNRNEERPDSLEAMIRTRDLANCLPIFTISDIQRFRSDRAYAHAVASKLIEYLFDAGKIVGTGRLYLP